MATEEELLKLKKAELVELAEGLDLDATGTKAELAALLAVEPTEVAEKETVAPTLLVKAEPELITKVAAPSNTPRYAPHTDGGFIEQCFHGQLGRLPTKEEVELWLGKLYGGNTRNWVQSQISDLEGRTGFSRLNSLESVGSDSNNR